MSEYKELIADLTAAANRNSNSLNTRDTCRKAADAIEQLVKERDAAIAAAENIHSDFVDFACTGISNLAPYCGNRCAECVDEAGWCKEVTKFCNGFISVEYTDWRANVEWRGVSE